MLQKLFCIGLLCNIITGWGQSDTTQPPNILWISCEDIGPAWGCYGDPYAATPHIDALADKGYTFTQAFSNAPICAPARSTLITGMYATSLGTQHLRSEIPVPTDLQILPELLSEAGYFTTNNSKTDYNFSPDGRWNENGNDAHWRNAPDGSPFFSVFNFGITHEGQTNRLDPELTASLDQHHDPDNAKLPPYFPETPKFQEVWAHMYDLISVFDQEVGKLVQQLKEDGLYENTIIFVFADHGFGLPRYKRWLYNSGLQVPLVLHVPDTYQDLAANLSMGQIDQMVGFVDFAPTMLTLAGADIPDRMEGKNFLGNTAVDKPFIYGYRDRADDCYDVARSIYDGRYLYVRHFMPHKPYIQNAVIFNKGKNSYEELFRLKEENELPPEAQDMFSRKPVEEVYDLTSDPYELNNLIESEELSSVITQLRTNLFDWMREHHDTGLLNEGEMMLRAKAWGSVYEMARNPDAFDVEKVLEAAQQVGTLQNAEEAIIYLNSDDAAVRYWGLVALDAFEGELAPQRSILQNLLEDDSPSVAMLAAEILIKRLDDQMAYTTLKKILRSDDEPVVLQAAISIRQLGEKAKPLIPLIQDEIMPRYSGNIWDRYRSWSYPMFIGMALDQTQINCGVEIAIKN